MGSIKQVSVIGAGFSGLSAAACLAQAGFDVTVIEKHAMAGGRARRFQTQGFTFDMGPSWYWMPDVFEKFFNRFGKKTADYYSLERLDPSYRIYYGKHDYLDVPANLEQLCTLFNGLEPGSGDKLIQFLNEAKYKYDTGINNLVYKPGLHWTELLEWPVIKGTFRLQLFTSMSAHVRKYFKNKRLIQLLEFPVLFLGATPQKTPALYSLMNYADMVLGTWYPKGGMYEIIRAMENLALEQGVKFRYDNTVSEIIIKDKRVTRLIANGQPLSTDYVVASADYHHIEQDLLPADFRNYPTKYWNTRAMAPSALIYFVGINKKLKGLRHHTLFFDQDFGQHASDIYTTPRWPESPQFYISCPSKTDPTVAPEGSENLFILVPVAPGLQDTPEIRDAYFKKILLRLESIIGETIADHIVYQRSYAHNDFQTDYNAFKGNAYGLANTLMQTAHLKPSMRNAEIPNLLYTGQLTVPGPGVPPSIISGQVAAELVVMQSKQNLSLA